MSGTAGTSTGGTSSGSGTTSGGALSSLPAGDCFTFATQAEQAYSTACGDLMALEGENVDLQSGAGSSQLCQLAGTFASLSDVPTSYTACAWTTYVEGAGGLANQGLIVLDSSGSHHYRMWIQSNTLPNLLFAFAPID